ncbi:MAG: ATP-grasp domain-containing protein [Vulcanimicrobiaceae bacterium]
MSDWPAGRNRENLLREIDAEIVASPDDLELRFGRACLLEDLGRADDAKHEYLAIVARDPTHFGALNNLGNVLLSQGLRSAARLTYAHAAAQHPDNPMGIVNLANVVRDDGDADAAKVLYEQALQLDPQHAQAHQGMAYVCDELGDEPAAALHRERGFRGQAISALRYRGAAPPIAVLLVVCSRGGNIFTDRLLDNRVFLNLRLFPEFYDVRLPLPPHALVFNAIGDAERCEEALRAATRLLKATDAPVINAPQAVLATGRIANAARLDALPGVTAPKIISVSRGALSESAIGELLAKVGLKWPILLRSPGFHMGRHFALVNAPGDLEAAVAQLPGEHLAVMEYLDARGADGCWRKYRVMIVDGKLYPLHLAVSRSWNVHYFSSDMAENAAYRDEEAAFLSDMPGTLGAPAVEALHAIAKILELDYGGIDFALSANGRILLFEANANMIAAEPEADPRWTYRNSAVADVHDAVRRMLLQRARPR